MPLRLIRSSSPLRAKIVVREVETLGYQPDPTTDLIVVRARKAEMVYGEAVAVGPDCPEPIEIGEIVHWRRQFGRELPDGLTMIEYDMIDAVGAT